MGCLLFSLTDIFYVLVSSIPKHLWNMLNLMFSETITRISHELIWEGGTKRKQVTSIKLHLENLLQSNP